MLIQNMLSARFKLGQLGLGEEGATMLTWPHVLSLSCPSIQWAGLVIAFYPILA